MDDISLRMRMLQLKQKGYCCTQIMLIMALESHDATNPQLVRAAGGLCYGVALSGEICGSLAGGACLLSLYTGKGSDDEQVNEKYPALMSELSQWFRDTIGNAYGGIRCDEILSNYPDKSACGPLVAATYTKVMEILDAHGIDRGEREND